jgi:dihydroneopterin aldolase
MRFYESNTTREGSKPAAMRDTVSGGGYSLVEKVAEELADGMKRFILYVLSAYLAIVIEHALS